MNWSLTGNTLADATLAGAMIAAIGSIVGNLILLHNQRKLQEIHVLVNSRLSRALARIESLEADLGVKSDDSVLG